MEQYKYLSNYEIQEILYGAKEIDYTNKKKCTYCNNTTFIEDYINGIITCICGQIIDYIIDNREEIHINNDNTSKDRLCYNRLLPQSSLCTSFNTYGKLRKLHIWSFMPYKERDDNLMYKRIHNVCYTYKIAKKLNEDAKILYKTISASVHKSGKNKGKPIITRGFNRAGIVAGCVFIVCKQNDDTRSIKEIAHYFNISEKDVNKGLRSMQRILNDNTISKDIYSSKVIHFIKRKCDELHIKNTHSDIAHTMAVNIDKLNIASNHTSYSLAAACILLMVNITNYNTINKKMISSVFLGLSDVTISKTYSQIKILKNILISDSLVNKIIDEIKNQNKKYIITQTIYDQMVRFNVDVSKYTVDPFL